MDPQGRAGENDRRTRRLRALKILNGLYSRDRYLPFADFHHGVLWNILLVPVRDPGSEEELPPPVFALVVPHSDDEGGDAFYARAKARSWIGQQFPDYIGEAGPPPAIVWVFGYMQASHAFITTSEGRNLTGIEFYKRAVAAGELEPDPSLMCGWRYIWSEDQFRSRHNYWIGKYCERVHIPASEKWHREPQRWVRGYRKQSNTEWKKRLSRKMILENQRKKGPPPKR